PQRAKEHGEESFLVAASIALVVAICGQRPRSTGDSINPSLQSTIAVNFHPRKKGKRRAAIHEPLALQPAEAGDGWPRPSR
ncbi:unnamed protein product, partial [Musa textilis]